MVEPCTEGWAGYCLKGSIMKDIQVQSDDALANNPTDIFKADTIEELAGKINIEPSVLKNTVDNYNKMIDDGFDSEFKKPAEFLRKVDGDP